MMKLLFENWRRYLKEEALKEAIDYNVGNLTRQVITNLFQTRIDGLYLSIHTLNVKLVLLSLMMGRFPDNTLIPNMQVSGLDALDFFGVEVPSDGGVFGMLGNGAEAEDIGQEVFIRLFKSIDEFKGEAKLATYITRIAINLSLNAIQRRKRKWQIFYSGEKKDERLNAFADSRTEKQKDEKELVRRAVSLLDSNYREVVVLKVFQGYKSKEVAEILQIPLGTVLTRYARAQKKLKILISELDSDYDR